MQARRFKAYVNRDCVSIFLYTEILFQLSASYNKFWFAEVAPLCSAFRATEAARSLSEVQTGPQ